MKIYFPKSIYNFRANYTAFSTWIDHLPFAYDLVAEIKPKVVVELGTQLGTSFFCFCQSMKENNIPGKCYAVDTWQGDEHTGEYDESFYMQVYEHAQNNYPRHAELLRMYFHEALEKFEDQSIDLLHIDGFHTYNAVKEDYENWMPKVKPGGIILFHDIKAKIQDFGAWRFWDELSKSQKTFTFNQGYGLGVLQKSGDENTQNLLLNLLFNSDMKTNKDLRSFYEFAAKHQELIRKTTRKAVKS